MTEQTRRRADARTHRRTAPRHRGAAAACAFALLTAAPLSAQVGHDPERSPFRDLTTHQGVSVFFGRFAGNTAVAGVGARPGFAVGARLDTRLSGPVDLWLSFARVASSRRVIDTTKDTLTRVSGPIDMPLILADVGIALNLTGAKSWRGLAPYAGFGMGFVAPVKPRTDPGGYRGGSNFAFVPTLGTRWFVARSLAVRVEARDYYYRYEWPSRYFLPNSSEDNPVPVLPTSLSDQQWTHNFTLSAGVTYVFNF